MRAVMSFSQRLVVLVAGQKIADGEPRRGRSATPKSRGPILASSLAIEGIHAGYGAVRVLEDVSLAVGAGETVVLLGTNGNGKSTLMKCIMGIVRPSAGQHHRRDRRHPARSRRPHHRGDRRSRHRAGAGRTAAVSQAHGRGEPAARRLPPEAARRELAHNLAFCFETFPRARRAARASSPAACSGGEQQMLALGRALMSAPKILLVDEPSVGLAPILVSRTIDKIKELKDRYQLTVLMAEQNFTQAIRIADRGYVIVHGKIAFEGGSADELNNNELIRKFYLGL